MGSSAAAAHGAAAERPPRRISRLFGRLPLPLAASQARASGSAIASPTGSPSGLAPPGGRADAARPRRRSSTWSLLPLGSPLPTPPLPPLLAEQFSNPDDVAAFAEALQDDAGQHDVHATDTGAPGGAAKTADQLGAEAGDAGEPEATPAALVKAPKVGRIAAASDFAPVRERRIRKPRAGAEAGVAREGAVYVLLRFPLLLCVWATIVLEFLAYVLVRQSVNALEWVMAWRGQRGRLRRRLRQATSWAEWRTTAHEMDAFMGYDAWKNVRESGLYDWRLVGKVHKSLKAFREQDDAENLLDVLDLCIRNNFAGIESFRLYSETFWGTKVAIESYLDEAERALRYIQETDKIPLERKRAFWRTLSKNLGKTALCLSGGGSFGYYHIGLVRALLDANLLPNIVTGTSAGGLIAALACTRSDEELREILVPELADRITACWEPISIWGPRVWRTGARFDTVQWAEKAQFFTRGSMTFLEAHCRTGKILNVSVIPADRHSPVKLLNYITAPHCIIWSALLASAAVPGILNPVCLMQKHPKTGKAETMSYGHRYKDGSLRVDIPLSDLHALYNVNYPIVSQVNPHVHLFFFAPKGMPGRPVAHRRGKGWRGGFILSAAEHIIKLHLSLNFKVLRDLQVQPRLLGQDWSNVFLQRFSGAVTIWPRTRAWDWVRILSDPDRKELRRMMQVSQSTTFPKLHMIDNRRRLEAAVEQGRHACRRAQRAQNAATPGAESSNVQTDGQLSTARLSDESAAETSGPGATGGGDFFSSKRVSRGGPTRLRDMARMVSYNSVSLSDEGAATPGEPETPGELPRHARLRSLGHHDEDDGEGSRSTAKRSWSRDRHNGSAPASNGVREHDFAAMRDGAATTDEDDNQEPLTAAALSPLHSNAKHHDSRRSLPRQHSKSKDGSGSGGHQWGDRGSMSAGGGLRWDEGESSASSDEE